MRRIEIMLLAAVLLCGCEKVRLDKEVDRLCKIDGGIRVYETVKLPKEDFDDRGIVFPQFLGLPEDNGRYGPGYKVVVTDTYVVDGNPSLRKSHIKVIRVSDQKLLGERINYTRLGGDLPSPFHPSSHACQNVNDDPGLIRQVFLRKD